MIAPAVTKGRRGAECEAGGVAISALKAHQLNKFLRQLDIFIAQIRVT